MTTDLKFGLIGAACFHLLLFSGFYWMEVPRYEVTVSSSSLEVSLVASRPERPVLFEKDLKQEEKEQEIEEKSEIESSDPTIPNLLRGAFTYARPREFENKPPRYPRIARQLGYEGRVHLRVWVTEFGNVDKVEIILSSKHKVLDQAAKQAVEKWRFEPARKFGIASSSHIDIPVVFSLEDK